MRIYIYLALFPFLHSCNAEPQYNAEVSFIVNSSCETSVREYLLTLNNLEGFTAELIPISHIREAYPNEKYLGKIKTTIKTVTNDMLNSYANGALDSCNFYKVTTFEINDEADMNSLVSYLQMKFKETPHLPMEMTISDGYIKIFEQ